MDAFTILRIDMLIADGEPDTSRGVSPVLEGVQTDLLSEGNKAACIYLTSIRWYRHSRKRTLCAVSCM